MMSRSNKAHTEGNGDTERVFPARCDNIRTPPLPFAPTGTTNQALIAERLFSNASKRNLHGQQGHSYAKLTLRP